MLCIIFFLSSKPCTSLSIPSKILDAKSPQGMCQRLLNTLCTLSLILHGCGFTVGEMQMAAHGIALWGNKGNTEYFSNAGFIFPAFIDFFAFFCCMDGFCATSYLPKALLYRQDFLHMTYKSLNFRNNERQALMAGEYFWKEENNPLKKTHRNPSSLCICPWTLEEGSHSISVLKFAYSQSKFPILGLERQD